jgi:hypothetical protein
MSFRVFIASSGAASSLAETVLSVLLESHPNAVFNLWKEGFGINRYPLDELQRHADTHTCGIFVFFPDDVVFKAGQRQHNVRDNVLFELGMFTGKLGRKNTFILEPESETLDDGTRIDFTLASDLQGITTARYKFSDYLKDNLSHLRVACRPISRALSRLESRAPHILHGGPDNYGPILYDRIVESKLALEMFVSIGTGDWAIPWFRRNIEKWRNEGRRSPIKQIVLKRFSSGVIARAVSAGFLPTDYENRIETNISALSNSLSASDVKTTLEVRHWSRFPEFHGFLFGNNLFKNQWSVGADGVLHNNTPLIEYPYPECAEIIAQARTQFEMP